MDDNPTDESELDMIVMMIETDTQKSIHPLNDTINTAHQIGYKPLKFGLCTNMSNKKT